MRRLSVLCLTACLGCAGQTPSVSLPTAPEPPSVPIYTEPDAPEERAPAWAPPARQGERRGDVWTYPYEDGRVYEVVTRVEAGTDLQLAPGEAIHAVIPADTKRWTFAESVSGTGSTQRAHVVVTPSEDKLSTTALITSSRGSYQLVLKVRPKGAMSIVRWEHPPLPVVKRRLPLQLVPQTSQAYYSRQALADPAPAWMPTAMWDDGLKTYVQFPPATTADELPMLYILDAEGKPQLVNYRYEAERRIMHIDRVFQQGELRVGIDPTREVVRLFRHGPPR